MTEPKYAINPECKSSFYLIADPAIFYMVLVACESGYRHEFRVNSIRGPHMAAKLVGYLNAPVPVYYPGRYIMDVFSDDEATFKDTYVYADTGEPLSYKVTAFPGLEKIQDIALGKLVGMLNYQEHLDQQPAKRVEGRPVALRNDQITGDDLRKLYEKAQEMISSAAQREPTQLKEST